MGVKKVKSHTEEFWSCIWTSQLPGVFFFCSVLQNWYTFLYIRHNCNNYVANLRWHCQKFSFPDDRAPRIVNLYFGPQITANSINVIMKWLPHRWDKNQECFLPFHFTVSICASIMLVTLRIGIYKQISKFWNIKHCR